MSRTRKICTFTILILSLAFVVACGNDDTDTENRDPDELVNQATERFEETESARFELEIEGSIALDNEGTLSLSSVEGEIERPSSARADASVQFLGSSVTMEIVAVDGQMHLRNILTGGWERAPSDLEYDPSRIFDEQEGISAILDQLENLETEGQEAVDGQGSWHVTGTVDAAAVQALTGDFFEGETLDVELWIAEDDHRLMRVELHDTGADSTSWVLRLFDHDEPVDISPPDAD